MKKTVKNGISVREFLKLGSSYRDIRLMRMSSKKITRDAAELHLLERYYHLLVNTDYLREEVYEFLVGQKTYEYISNTYGTHKNYLRNVIYKEVQKIFEDIADDPFAVVRYGDYVSEEDRKDLVDILTERIEVLISNHQLIYAENLSEFMVMDIEKHSDVYREYNGAIDEELFYDTVDRLKYLSKPYLNALFTKIDRRLLGYILYLLNTKDSNLSERDINNKQVIKESWFLPKKR